MKSPCLTCTKVKDPCNCENKLCGKWRVWFLSEWEKKRTGLIGYVKKDDR